MGKALKYFGIVICLVVLHAALAPYAEAALTKFGDNYYEFVEVSEPLSGTNNTWETANASASARSYNGVSGHLATITSQAENDFLLGLVPVFSTTARPFSGSWLGGLAGVGWLVGPEAGQAFSYTNWGGEEPNNNGYAYMNIGASHYSGILRGQWADDSGVNGFPDGNDPVVGYFVEYEKVSSVPVPAAVWLLGSGLVGIIGMKRRFKK